LGWEDLIWRISVHLDSYSEMDQKEGDGDGPLMQYVIANP